MLFVNGQTMKKIFTISCFVMALVSFPAQKNGKIYGNEKPYEQAETFPVFLSEQSGFRKQLDTHIDFSKLDTDKDYDSQLEFIIEKDGSMSSVKSSGDYPVFNTEVEAAVKKIKAKWQAAVDEGIKVRYHVSMPVSHHREERGMASPYNMFGKKKADSRNLYTTVEVLPYCKGGIGRFKNTVASGLGKTIENYPFTVSFIVETDGNLSDIQVTGQDKDKNELIRKEVVKNTLKWNPAQHEGRDVRFRFPVKFP